MVILGVDYGDIRTGIAACDKSEILASPVCTVKETNPEKLALTIKELALERGAELIVLGNPKNMNNSEGFRSEKSKKFGIILEEITGIPVILRDERLSTVVASSLLHEGNVFGKKNRKVIDAASAAVILQGYLDEKN